MNKILEMGFLFGENALRLITSICMRMIIFLKRQMARLNSGGLILKYIVAATLLANIISFIITYSGFNTFGVKYTGISLFSIEIGQLLSFGMAFLVQSCIFSGLYVIETRQLYFITGTGPTSAAISFGKYRISISTLKMALFIVILFGLMLLSIKMNLLALASAGHKDAKMQEFQVDIRNATEEIYSVKKAALETYSNHIATEKKALQAQFIENCKCRCEKMYDKYERLKNRFSVLNEFIQGYEFENRKEVDSAIEEYKKNKGIDRKFVKADTYSVDIEKRSVKSEVFDLNSVTNWARSVSLKETVSQKDDAMVMTDEELIKKYNAAYRYFILNKLMFSEALTYINTTVEGKLSPYSVTDVNERYSVDSASCSDPRTDKAEWAFPSEVTDDIRVKKIVDNHKAFLERTGAEDGSDKTEIVEKNGFLEKAIIKSYVNRQWHGELGFELMIACLFEVCYIFLILLAHLYRPSPWEYNEFLKEYASRYDEQREVYRRLIRGRLQETLHSRILRGIDDDMDRPK